MPSLPCRDDPLVQFLNGDGWNALLTRRTGIEPPQLFTHDGSGSPQPWGPLAGSLNGATLPPLEHGELQTLERTQTAEKGARASASFLETVLTALGLGGAPKLDLSFAGRNAMTFRLGGTTWRGLPPSAIAAALEHFEPRGLSPEVVRGGMLYIAYEYAFATSLLLKLEGGREGAADLQALKVEGYIELGAKAEAKAVNASTLAFSARGRAAPIAFAFRAGRVARRNRRWEFEPRETLGQEAAADAGQQAPLLLLQPGLVMLEEEADAAYRAS